MWFVSVFEVIHFAICRYVLNEVYYHQYYFEFVHLQQTICRTEVQFCNCGVKLIYSAVQVERHMSVFSDIYVTVI